MSTAEYKSNINALMEQIEDQNILANVFRYLDRFSKVEKGEQFELSNEQKNAIDQGLDSLEKDGTLSHEEVMADVKKKFPNL